MLPSDYQRYIVADAFVTQTLVNSRQGKLYGNSHIVPDPGGSSACAAAETVDGNDVGAASCDSACDCCDIMYCGNFNDNRFFVFRSFFQGENKLTQILDGIDIVMGAGEMASEPSGIIRVRETSPTILPREDGLRSRALRPVPF